MKHHPHGGWLGVMTTSLSAKSNMCKRSSFDVSIMITPCENILNEYLAVDGPVAISGASYKACKFQHHSPLEGRHWRCLPAYVIDHLLRATQKSFTECSMAMHGGFSSFGSNLMEEVEGLIDKVGKIYPDPVKLGWMAQLFDKECVCSCVDW